MPILLDPTVFEEELFKLRRHLTGYLSDAGAWGKANRSNWFLSWYRGSQSWLRGSSLERVIRAPQAQPSGEVSPFDRYGKSAISNLLINYENAPWYKRFVWWFRLPLTKMYSLNAVYQVLDRLPTEKGKAVDVFSIKEAIDSHLVKIRPASRVFSFFKQAQDKIEIKIKYSPSNQLKISFGEYLEELAKYGKKSKGFFSWQSHAELALELGFDKAHYRRTKQAELARIPNKTSAQRKEQEVLYYVLLKESIENCVSVLSHPVPDKATQESAWSQVIGNLVAIMTKAAKDLPASSFIRGLLQQITKEFNVLIKESTIEVQIANYREILSASIHAKQPSVVPSIQANEQAPDANVKRLPLNPTSLAICKKLGVTGVSDDSQEVIWDNIRSRYKALCQQYHPDKYQDEASKKAATESFQTLQNDYKLLLNELENGQGEGDDAEFDREIREERERMNSFFTKFQQELDNLNKDLKEVQQGTEAVSNELDALKIRQKEQQKKVEEQTIQLRQQAEQVEGMFQSVLHTMQQRNPNVRLLRLTSKRCEACIKLGVKEITEDSAIVSWNDIRSQYDKLTASLSFDQLVKAPKQQMIDRFQELKETYKFLLDELSKPAAGENRTNFDQEILREREELNKLTLRFQSDLKKCEEAEVEEAQQASVSRMSP